MFLLLSSSLCRSVTTADRSAAPMWAIKWLISNCGAEDPDADEEMLPLSSSFLSIIFFSDNIATSSSSTPTARPPLLQGHASSPQPSLLSHPHLILVPHHHAGPAPSPVVPPPPPSSLPLPPRYHHPPCSPQPAERDHEILRRNYKELHILTRLALALEVALPSKLKGKEVHNRSDQVLWWSCNGLTYIAWMVPLV